MAEYSVPQIKVLLKEIELGTKKKIFNRRMPGNYK